MKIKFRPKAEIFRHDSAIIIAARLYLSYIRLHESVAHDAQWVPQPQKNRTAVSRGDDGTLRKPLWSNPGVFDGMTYVADPVENPGL